MAFATLADLDVADENLTGFASNVTGASFTISTTATDDGLAHRVSIRNDSATDHSGKTVTLVGTDADDRAQTEIVTGPGTSATVESTKYFKTLTSATPSATIGSDTFDIGWVDEVASPTWFTEALGTVVSHAFAVTGTLNYTMQAANMVTNDSGITDQESIPWAPTDVASKTASQIAMDTAAFAAYRAILNSYSSGARLRWSRKQTRS